MKLSPAFDSLSDALKKVKCFGILKKNLTGAQGLFG